MNTVAVHPFKHYKFSRNNIPLHKNIGSKKEFIYPTYVD